MTRRYATEAVVLGYRKLGEADRIIDLFTENLGRVPTVVKGIRKVSSRWGGRLEPFSHLQAQLYAGRNLHTLTGADIIQTHAGLRDQADCLQAGLSLSEMITRSTPEHQKKPRTYNLLLRYLQQMDRLCRETDAAKTSQNEFPAGGSPQINDDPVAGRDQTAGRQESVVVLTLAAQLKILLLAGFLPELGACAVCGSDAKLVAFAAAAGGAVCDRCQRNSFPAAAESLTTMQMLLENALADTAGVVRVTGIGRRQIRRAIVEICEYHLGIRLKVEPWREPLT